MTEKYKIEIIKMKNKKRSAADKVYKLKPPVSVGGELFG